MQNIDLICVGKLNAKYFAEGVAEYQKRLAAFAAFRIIELPEEKIEEKNASDAVVKKALDKEGKAILSNVRKGAATLSQPSCASTPDTLMPLPPSTQSSPWARFTAPTSSGASRRTT